MSPNLKTAPWLFLQILSKKILKNIKLIKKNRFSRVLNIITKAFIEIN